VPDKEVSAGDRDVVKPIDELDFGLLVEIDHHVSAHDDMELSLEVEGLTHQVERRENDLLFNLILDGHVVFVKP
jgi:hypothetical protein